MTNSSQVQIRPALSWVQAAALTLAEPPPHWTEQQRQALARAQETIKVAMAAKRLHYDALRRRELKLEEDAKRLAGRT